MLVALAGGLDRFLFNNDGLTYLASGYRTHGPTPAAQRLYDAGLGNCEAVLSTSPRELAECRAYQQIILIDDYFNYPIFSLFGMSLQKAGDGPSLAAEVQRALIGASFLSTGLAALLMLVLAWNMPSELRFIVGAVLVAGIVAGFSRDGGKIGFLDPMHQGQTSSEAILIALVIAAGLVGSRLAAPLVRIPGATGPSRADQAHLALVVGCWSAVALLLVAMTGAIDRAVEWAALILAIVLAIAACWRVRLPAFVAIVASLAFLLSITASDVGIFPSFFGAPRQLLFVLFAIYVCHATVSPSGRLVWIAPAFLAFHVAGSAVLAASLILAEVPLCLRRRRVSPLLLASLLWFVGAFAIMSTWQSGIYDWRQLPLAEFIAFMLASPRLVPSVVTTAVLLAAAVYLLVDRNRRWDGLARILILLAIALGAAQLAAAIVLDTADPAFWFRPGWFTFGRVERYLLPGVSYAAILVLCWMLVRDRQSSRGPVGVPSSAGRWGSKLDYILPVCIVLALFAARYHIKPSLIPKAAINARDFLIEGRLHPSAARQLTLLRRDDDVYYVSRGKPTNSPMTYLSVLKMRIRAADGSLEPERVEVRVGD